MEKKKNSALTYGLIISLILIIVSLVVYFTNLYTENWAQYVGMAIFAIAIILSVINYAKENQNTVKFGTLFGFGFKVTAVIICIMIIYTILSGYLFPEAKTKIIEIARERALSQNGATEEQVDAGMKFFEKNYTLFIIIGLLFWYMICGVIASLIGAAIPKKQVKEDFTS